MILEQVYETLVNIIDKPLGQLTVTLQKYSCAIESEDIPLAMVLRKCFLDELGKYSLLIKNYPDLRSPNLSIDLSAFLPCDNLNELIELFNSDRGVIIVHSETNSVTAGELADKIKEIVLLAQNPDYLIEHIVAKLKRRGELAKDLYDLLDIYLTTDVDVDYYDTDVAITGSYGIRNLIKNYLVEIIMPHARKFAEFIQT